MLHDKARNASVLNDLKNDTCYDLTGERNIENYDY